VGADLKRLRVAKHDSVRVYRLCAACADDVVVLGLGDGPQDPAIDAQVLASKQAVKMRPNGVPRNLE
jgi:hypothetical protein